MASSPALVASRLAGSSLRLPLTLLLGTCAVFVLPFAHAPAHPVLSVSYTAGCDNRLAELGLLALSAITFVRTWRTGRRIPQISAPEQDGHALSSAQTLPAYLTSSLVVITTIFTLLLGALVVHAGVRYGESAYFIERTRDALRYHMLIYRDMEFPYGPLLLYPQVFMAHLLGSHGVSVTEAYFLSLAAMNALGLLLVVYLLNRMPLTSSWRLGLLLLFATLQLHPLAGPNYSLFKFAAPFALFVWAVTRSSEILRWFACVCAHLSVLLISPELAVGMTTAFVTFALLSSRRSGSGNLRLLLAPVVSSALFFLAFGRLFLHRLGQAAGGALNLIPEPTPHLVLYSFAVIWLVPAFVGMVVRERREEAPLLASLFLLSIGMLPGAMGRCDPLHVVFYGFGIFVLSAAAVTRLSRNRQRIWAASLVLLAGWTQSVNYALYAPEIALLLHPPRPAKLDIAALRQATGNASVVATPALANVPLSMELQLRHSGLFLPDYYPGLAEVWDEASEQRKIRDMRQQAWILLPGTLPIYSEPLPNTPVKLAMRLGYRYRQRQTPYRLGALLASEVQTGWTPVRHFGDLTLYRQR